MTIGFAILSMLVWIAVNAGLLAALGPILHPKLTEQRFSLVGAFIGGITGGLCTFAFHLITRGT